MVLYLVWYQLTAASGSQRQVRLMRCRVSICTLDMRVSGKVTVSEEELLSVTVSVQGLGTVSKELMNNQPSVSSQFKCHTTQPARLALDDTGSARVGGGSGTISDRHEARQCSWCVRELHDRRLRMQLHDRHLSRETVRERRKREKRQRDRDREKRQRDRDRDD